MQRARTQGVNGRIVLGRGIAFMLREAITWIRLVETNHHPVARHLGQDAGRSDGVTFRVALHEGGLRIGKPADAQAIDQDVLRARVELFERQVHGPPGGLANVDAINHLHIDGGDGGTDIAVGRQNGEVLFALLFSKLLGVVEPAKLREQTRLSPGRRKHDRRSHHRPRQWAATGFIHSGHEPDALCPKLALMR